MYDPDDVPDGKDLKAMRIKSGLSRHELASRTGVCRRSLVEYEHGDRSPTVAKVRQLIAAINSAIETSQQ